MTLSALAPRRGELLWDIGAGSGSVAIEWMLADPSMRAIAIEADPERAARIAATPPPAACRAWRRRGQAPAALAGLDQPDAIFIGGGGSDAGVLDAAIDALKPGGRLVANAVTLEMEALLLAKHRELGGELDPHRHFARNAGRLDERLAAGHAGHAMVVGEAMIVAGIGCRKGVSADEVLAAIDAALDALRLARRRVWRAWRPARPEAATKAVSLLASASARRASAYHCRLPN